MMNYRDLVINIKHNSQARSVRFHIYPGYINVVTPKISLKKITKMIDEHYEKLCQKQGKLREIVGELKVGSYLLFYGISFLLIYSEGKKAKVDMVNATISVGTTEPEKMKKQLRELYMEAVRNNYVIRIKTLATQLGYEVKKVKISTASSRWGSCSRQGNINLTFLLAQLPANLVDSVLIHELVHLEYFNHSKHFWNKVLQIIPSYFDDDKAIKNIQRSPISQRTVSFLKKLS